MSESTFKHPNYFTMKKYCFAVLATTILLTASSISFGQKKQNYVPEKGYWQLVSNIHEKKAVTVRFYTDENTMIYEEKISNKKLNPNRQRVRRQLYYALQEAYNQWASNRMIKNNDLVVKRK